MKLCKKNTMLQMSRTDFKAIIFDMDGVFVDSETILFDIFRRVFAPLSISLPNEYQYKFIGQPFSNNLKDIQQDYGVELDETAVRRQFDSTYEEILANAAITVQDGIMEIVRTAQKNNMKLGLCTTSTRHHVDVIFSRIKHNSFDPHLLFAAVVTGDSVTFKKPHPEPYLNTTKKLCERPKDCLVIEDSVAGLQSAKAAGCFCVALRQPYNRHIDFAAADMTVERLAQVLSIIQDGSNF